MVGDDRVGAGATERGEDLQHRGALVEVAGSGGGLDHRILATDVVGRDRQARGALDRADQVAVGERWLDHHHVRALLDIQQRLADGLATVGGIHLIAAAVTECGAEPAASRKGP